MKKQTSFKDIKDQFNENLKRANKQFKEDAALNKIRNAEMRKKMKEKPKSKPKSSVNKSGGKGDSFNVFGQMFLGLLMSIPLFLIALVIIIFMGMMVWSFIF